MPSSVAPHAQQSRQFAHGRRATTCMLRATTCMLRATACMLCENSADVERTEGAEGGLRETEGG
jgi:hypothetical protein